MSTFSPTCVSIWIRQCNIRLNTLCQQKGPVAGRTRSKTSLQPTTTTKPTLAPPSKTGTLTKKKITKAKTTHAERLLCRKRLALKRELEKGKDGVMSVRQRQRVRQLSSLSPRGELGGIPRARRFGWKTVEQLRLEKEEMRVGKSGLSGLALTG
ncbi:hypothetical protein HRS9122_00038 [Pyrenophora teres f. teres]|nr:hypothetical protein HRS9122_00038 [Pyrenophora teres f. teres]